MLQIRPELQIAAVLQNAELSQKTETGRISGVPIGLLNWICFIYAFLMKPAISDKSSKPTKM